MDSNFPMRNISAKLKRGTINGGAKCRWGGLKRYRAFSLPGANRPIGLWPIRSLANSLPVPFVPWPFRSLALSLRGPFAPDGQNHYIFIMKKIIQRNQSNLKHAVTRKSDIKTIHSESTLEKKTYVTQLKPWFRVKIKLF